jgi:hypothetical protein
VDYKVEEARPYLTHHGILAPNTRPVGLFKDLLNEFILIQVIKAGSFMAG